ncbi:MAG TPA: GtrA family protein [Oscillospiraceae bacterium]|nr:GtrA family protein [Oscillospiraceae bacterium]
MNLRGLTDGKNRKQFIRFCLIGVLNTAVDYAVFSAVSLFSENIYLAQTCGYAAGVLNSYTLNRKWTFDTQGKFFSPEFVKFIVVNLVSYAASLGALWLLADVWGLNKYFAKILLVGVTLVINFVLNRIWVFGGSGEGGPGVAEKRNQDDRPQ